MSKILHALFILLLFIVVAPVSAADKPLTDDTGQLILKELREIKQLLEKQQRPQPQAQQQAAPAQPEKVSLKGGGAHMLGKSDAPLVLIEYTDYQCPFCKRFYDGTFVEIKKNLIDTGKVRFISRNMPLPFHAHAKKAAQAAFCAGEQAKYWEMRDALFKNQNKLEDEATTGYAKELALKADVFKSCMDDERSAKEVSDEAAYAGSIGITGTPTFVLGRPKGDLVEGRKIVGAQPYAAFETQVNELLRENAK
jgi:protein-disulfide isomerase